VISADDFQSLVEQAFRWLLRGGYRVVELESHGNLGHLVRLSNGRLWLKVAWETREDGVFVAWGQVLGPGSFNDDPYRNPRPLDELLPGPSTAEIEQAGSMSRFRPGDSCSNCARPNIAVGRRAGA
jgi:hypothetical protein